MPDLRRGIQVAQPAHETPLQVSPPQTGEIKGARQDSKTIVASTTASITTSTATSHTTPGCS